eukprot:3829689-Pyramimonas_sp.AAC.1
MEQQPPLVNARCTSWREAGGNCWSAAPGSRRRATRGRPAWQGTPSRSATARHAQTSCGPPSTCQCS